MKTFIRVSLAFIAAGASAVAQDGWTNQGPAPKTRTVAAYSSGNASVAASADEPTEYIRSIARALHNDPVRIYEWVVNTVDYAPYAGLKRGAHLTALERVGNDADTAALLVSLLRAAGHTNVKYRYGDVKVSISREDAQDAAHWLAVDAEQVRNYLECLNLTSNETKPFDPSAVRINLVRVLFTQGNTTYELVPSFKAYAQRSGRSLSSIGYSSTMLDSAAAGTYAEVAGTPSGSSFLISAGGRSGLRSLLDTYASNLATTSLTDTDAPTGAEFAGVPARAYLPISQLPQSLPPAFQPIGGADADRLPAGYGVRFRMMVGALEYVCPTSDLQGKKLAICFNGKNAELWLDDTRVAAEAGGDPATPAAVRFGFELPAYVSESNLRAAAPLDRTGTYVVSYGFGSVNGRLQERLRFQSRHVADKKDASQRELRTENLYVMGLQYQNQLAGMNEVASGVLKGKISVSEHLGISGYVTAPFVDLPYHNIVTWPAKTLSADPEENRVLSEAWKTHVFKCVAYYSSLLEHTTVEQTVGGEGASTVKMVQRAAELGYPFYLAKSSQDYSVIKGLITDFPGLRVSAGEVRRIDDAMAAGAQVLLCKSNNLAYNSYRGSGYLLDRNSSVVMGIAGGLAGGYGTSPTSFVATHFYDDWGAAPASATQTGAALPVTKAGDPVDMTTGAFYHEAEDLSLGEAAPHGLSFSRRYTTARANFDPVGLGRGWTHSYNIAVRHRHPNDFHLGRATAAEVAPLMVGIQAIYDLYRTDGNAKHWVVPAIVSCWIGDQLLDTRASVSMGDREMEFVKLPNGGYAPPPGIAATLVKNGTSTYTLSFRKGNEVTFRVSDGAFTKITDRNNSAGTAYSLLAAYDSSGRLIKVTDSYGRHFTLAYGSGQLISVTDSTGRVVEYGNGLLGDRTRFTVKDPEGNVSVYEGDKQYRIDKVYDRKGQLLVTSVYDPWDRVTDQDTFGLQDHHWTYGFAEGVGRTTDPKGGELWHYFDGRGRLWRKVNETREVVTAVYDGEDRVVSTTSPAGEKTKFRYNRNHELVRVTDNLNRSRINSPASEDSVSAPLVEGNFEGQTVTTTYYPYHKVKNVTSPGGIVTAYEYDARGRVSAVYPAAFAPGGKITYAYTLSGGVISRVVATYPNNTTEITDFSPLGDPVQTIDRLGSKTTFVYDKNRRLTQTARWTGTYLATSPLGGTPPAGSLITSVEYDANGDTSSSTIQYDAPAGAPPPTAISKTTRYDYSASGKVLAVYGPDGVLQQDNYYDNRDLLFSSFNAVDAQTSYKYDLAQRVTETFDPLVRRTEQAYENGRLKSTMSPRGHVSSTGYDELGRLKTTTDAKQQVVTYGYDKDGRQTSLTNRRGKTYTTVYDDPNRKVTTYTPLLRARTTETNTRGLLVKQTEPSGETVEMTQFDGEGRVLTQVHKNNAGATTATVAYTYHPGGLLNTATETPASGPVSKSTRIYDEWGRVKTYVYAENNVEVYRLGYDYYANGQLWKITYPGGVDQVTYAYDSYDRLKTVTDWANRTTTYTYDAAGRLTRVDRPNATWRKLVYDIASQLRQIEERAPGPTPEGVLLWYRSMRYDKTGLDFNVTDNDGEQTWSYTYPTPQSFALPADSATYDDDNQLLTWTPAGGAAQSPVFDLDGNMTTGPTWTGASGGTYAYDTRNRLISHAGLAYRYSVDGFRVQAGGTSYMVDPSGALSRVLVRVKNGVVTRYVWGAGLLYEETNGSTTTYHADHQGSTVMLTNASATVTDRVEYAPYGQITHRTGTADTPFLLHGALGVETDGNGLVYMRARFYHVRLMRFLNADPIGFAGGLNWYAYANGNPVMMADPSGHVAETIWDAANVVMGGYSLQDNVRKGNWGWAALDAVGLIYDGAATAVPFLPGGASAAFKASRAGASVVHSAQIGMDVAKIADKTHDAARAMDAAQMTSQQAARAGTVLHNQIDTFARSNLSDMFESGFKGTNRAAGSPDMLWPSSPGVWGDVTTSGKWNQHVSDYWALGDGIPVIYQAGRGVTNMTRLHSGAGVGFGAAQLLSGSGGSGSGRK